MRFSVDRTRVFAFIMLIVLLAVPIVSFFNAGNTLTRAQGVPWTNLEILPGTIQKSDVDIGTSFLATVTIENVTDLRGFDMNITWNNNLITLGNIFYTDDLNAIWGVGNVQIIENQPGTGWYKLVALSTNTGFTDAGAQALFVLNFTVDDPHTIGVSQTTLHFLTHKLSNSNSDPIDHNVYDAVYTITVNTYTLATNRVGSGTVNLNNTGPYHYGDVILLTAVPSIGWGFSSWSGDVNGSVNPATLVLVQNSSVTATFTQNLYSISTTSIGGGSVNFNNIGPYHYGDIVTLTATPNIGWLFDHWSGDITGSTNPVTLDITRSMSVTATFIQINYTLTINIIGSGNVNLNSSAPYDYGDVVELTAVPSVGWSFGTWSGGLSGSAGSEPLTITGNMSVTATFVQVNYSLTIYYVGNGIVTLNMTSPYNYGDAVLLTAVPGNRGWSFYSWSGNLVGSTSPAVLIITGNMVVNATFTGQDLYIITLNIFGNGIVSKSPNQLNYTYGSNVTLLASPNPGWYFNFWSGDVTGSANPVTVNLTSDMVVNATFAPNVYFLTLNTAGAGNIANNITGPINYNDCIQLWPTASSGWVFQYWTGNLSGSANPANLYVTDNFTVTAHFLVKPMLQMNPASATCSVFGQSFEVAINLYHANPYAIGLRFEIHYNVTLITYSNITWNAWGNGTITVDPIAGNISGYTSGTRLLIANQTLITFQFQASAHHVWKSGPNWQNNLTDAVYFQNANVSYTTGPDLTYQRGGINQITVGPDFVYTFSPIKGDVNNDGTVDLFDLRAATAYYGAKTGDLNWGQASTYDLNGDGKVNSSDFDIIASNYEYSYIPSS